MRRCVGCGEMKIKKEMFRVIKTPEQEILLDITGKKNGRGAYLCMQTGCLKKAEKNRGIERSLKTSVSKEVIQQLIKEMQEFETR